MSDIDPAEAWAKLSVPPNGSGPIPADVTRPCIDRGCIGTRWPVLGTQSFDADGSAMVALNCDTCTIQSVAYWIWTY